MNLDLTPLINGNFGSLHFFIANALIYGLAPVNREPLANSQSKGRQKEPPVHRPSPTPGPLGHQPTMTFTKRAPDPSPLDPQTPSHQPIMIETKRELLSVWQPRFHHSSWYRTVGQNNQESSTGPLVCLFAHSLTPITRSPALLLCLLPRSWKSRWFDEYFFCVFFYSGP